MDLLNLHRKLNKSLIVFFSEIESFGFKVSIVGGFCRDFLNFEIMSTDIDIEIRPIDLFLNSSLDTSKLYSFLSTHYKTELLKFNILRVEVDGNELEISLPRLEHFDGTFSHSNFSEEFIADPDYRRGPLRRDFTLNAIYFEYSNKEFSLVDPLGGGEDLKSGRLKPCSTDFDKDPVRFLRLIRFILKYDFSCDESLLKMVKELAAKKPIIFSSYYLSYEAIKSTKPVEFFSRLFSFDLDVNIQGIRAWDKLFKNNLQEHLSLCPYLDIKTKKLLLQNLNISTKKCISFDKKIDIRKESASNLEQVRSILGVMDSSSLSKESLHILIKEVFLNFELEDYFRYKKEVYSLTAEDLKKSPDEYWKIILKKKLGV